MPHLDQDLSEGLGLRKVRGKLELTLAYHASGLAIATLPEMMGQALALTASGDTHTGANLPEDGEELVVRGTTLYANSFDAEPWSADGATVRVTYTEDKRGPTSDFPGFGPTIKEVGATLEELQSNFSWDELQKPYAERAPLVLRYDPSIAGAPPGPAPYNELATVPVLRPRPVLNFWREQTADPEPIADFYVGRYNDSAWRGYPAETVLVLSIIGRNIGDGKWNTHYQFARDPAGFKNVVAVIRNLPVDVTPPSLAQITAGNGGQIVVVAGPAAFGGLNIS